MSCEIFESQEGGRDVYRFEIVGDRRMEGVKETEASEWMRRELGICVSEAGIP